MRLRGQLLEWVDPEPAPGDKGYDLKCEAQESDLFRTVTVTTKGFSFTAKAVRVTDDGKVVTFAIVD
jgi:hypothetical protein